MRSLRIRLVEQDLVVEVTGDKLEVLNVLELVQDFMGRCTFSCTKTGAALCYQSLICPEEW